MIYAILLFAFLLRIVPRLILPNAITDDGYSHYEDVNILKNNGFIPPRFYNKTVFKQLFGYPYGLMYLFVFLPKKLHRTIEILVSPVSDTLMIYLAYRFFKYFAFVNHVQIDENYYCLFAGVLATYSIYLRNDSGPRAYHGSSRVISQLFYVCLNYSFYHFYVSNNYYYLVISIFFGFLVILFSIFGTQVLFLTGLTVVCSGIWTYALVPCGALVLFYLITWRKGHQMIVARLWHYEWYFKFFQHVHLAKWKFLSSPFFDYLRNIKEWFKLLFRFNIKSLLIYFNIYNNPIHLLVASYFCYFFIFNSAVVSLSDANFVVVLSLGCLIAFAATLFRKLLFLGESYRYLEFGVVFAMVLLFVFLNEYKQYTLWPIILWICIGLFRYVFYQYEFIRKYRLEHQNYEKHIKVFSDLNDIIKGNTYGSPYFRTRAAYFGNFDYIALRGMQNIRIESLKTHQLAFGNYPMPHFDFNEIISHFNLQYWLTRGKEFDAYKKEAAKYGNMDEVFKKVYENSELDIVLYKIESQKRN